METVRCCTWLVDRIVNGVPYDHGDPVAKSTICA